MTHLIKVFMREKNFLFKLGAVLVPAVFASDSLGHALWIAPGVVLVLAVSHVWGMLMRRAVPAFDKGGFWAELPMVVMIGLAACLLDDLAARSGYGAGVLFPAALVNAGLWFRDDSFQVKSRGALWFLPAFLALAALKTSNLWPGFSDPFFIFTGAAAFLYLTGLALEKKWSSL